MLFRSHDDVKSIVANLIENRSKFADWDNPVYYNIVMFQNLEAGLVGKPIARTPATLGATA